MILPTHLHLEISDTAVILQSACGMLACSSAPWGGGIRRVNTIANFRVGNQYDSHHPEADLIQYIRAKGLEPTETIGLLTAAVVADAAMDYRHGEEFSLWAIVTAGIGNALRAGCAEHTFSGYVAETINTIVLVDALLTESALINAVITATEAKTAALQDEQIVDHQGRTVTGTSTDAVVIASTLTRREKRSRHLYAGSATELGDALAKAVYTATRQAIQRERMRAYRRHQKEIEAP